MGQRIPVADTLTSADILCYINDMVVQLMVMANRAGQPELARRLGEAIEQPQVFAWPGVNKNPPNARL